MALTGGKISSRWCQIEVSLGLKLSVSVWGHGQLRLDSPGEGGGGSSEDPFQGKHEWDNHRAKDPPRVTSLKVHQEPALRAPELRRRSTSTPVFTLCEDLNTPSSPRVAPAGLGGSHTNTHTLKPVAKYGEKCIVDLILPTVPSKRKRGKKRKRLLIWNGLQNPLSDLKHSWRKQLALKRREQIKSP